MGESAGTPRASLTHWANAHETLVTKKDGVFGVREGGGGNAIMNGAISKESHTEDQRSYFHTQPIVYPLRGSHPHRDLGHEMDGRAPLHLLGGLEDASAVGRTGGVGAAVVEGFEAEFFGDGELQLREEPLGLGWCVIGVAGDGEEADVGEVRVEEAGPSEGKC